MARAPFVKSLWISVILAAVYFAAGKLGLMVAVAHPSATAVWAPTGIALAAVLRFGYGVWPGIFLGAFLVNVTTAGSVATSIGIAAGNTLEGLVGSYLVNRFAGGITAFNRPSGVFRFAVHAALGSTTVSATFGVTSLALGGYADWASYGSIWFTWWLGDAGGALIVAPLLLLWGSNARLRWNWKQLLEVGFLLLSFVAATQVVFGDWSPVRNPPPLFYVVVLVWAAFRFSQRETATVTFFIAAVSIWGTLGGIGPFVRESPHESFLLLALFMCIISVTVMVLAAGVSERRRVEEERLKEAVERARAYEALEKSEELHRQARLSEALLARAQQIAHVGSFRWDAATNRVTWSDELYRIYGRTPAEFSGTFEAFLSCVHPDDRAEARNVVERALGERQPFRMRERIVRLDGEIRVLDSAGEVVVDAAGQAVELYGVCRDITDEQQAEESVRQLSSRLLQAQDEEQQRIARELQGGAARTLDALRSQLSAVKDSGTVFDWKTSNALEKSLKLARDATEEVRSLSYLLYPRLLDEAGLVEAIRWFEGRFAQRTGIKVVMHIPLPAKFGRLSRDAERTLFRVVQESLTNIHRHSGSQSAEIRLTEDSYAVRLEVKDRGKGIPPGILEGASGTVAIPGVGIRGMFERVRQLGGRLEIDSNPRGTTVAAILPVSSARPQEGGRES